VSVRPCVSIGELAGRGAMKIYITCPYRFQGYFGFYEISTNCEQTECPDAKNAKEN
jgi:hypothetical protein